MEKKFKYKELLEKFPNCPPNDYSEIENEAFRWVHKDVEHENNFKPALLISPQRKFDESDSNCKGYGLSLFDTLLNSLEAYKYQYNKRNTAKKKGFFIEDKGNCIASLNINNNDGIASVPDEDNNGHITFHEYNGVDLRSKISAILPIFAANGKFND